MRKSRRPASHAVEGGIEMHVPVGRDREGNRGIVGENRAMPSGSKWKGMGKLPSLAGWRAENVRACFKWDKAAPGRALGLLARAKRMRWRSATDLCHPMRHLERGCLRHGGRFMPHHVVISNGGCWPRQSIHATPCRHLEGRVLRTAVDSRHTMPSSRAKVRRDAPFFTGQPEPQSRIGFWPLTVNAPGSFDAQGIPLVARAITGTSRQNTFTSRFSHTRFHRPGPSTSVRVDRWIETRHGSPPLGMQAFLVKFVGPSGGCGARS